MRTTTWRITLIGTALDVSKCPPALAYAVFPAYNGWPCVLAPDELIITAPSSIAPADLGPLVKVEEVPSN